MENSACLNNFPNDLILEILSRLPVKSLFRFRCVSRSWYSLVSNPNFIKKHLNKSANNTNFKNHNFLLQTFKGNETKHCSVHSVQSYKDSDPPLKAVTFVDPPWMDKYDDVRIWGSCNGLICIGVGLTDVYLWNPAMKKSKKLPSSGMEFNGSHFSAYGLGYEEANDDYKVVMIHGSVTDHMYNDKVVKIYSSKKNSWEIFKNVTLPNGISTTFGAIFVNGKFNFQIIDFQHPSGAQMNHISVLDLEHGGKNLAPPEYGGANLWTLCEVNGKLSAFCENINNKQNDVWILTEDNSWSKIMSIPCLSTNNQRYYSYPMPFWVRTSSSANGEELLLKSDEGFVLYNPKGDSFRRLETDFDHYHLVGIYADSLVFPYND